MQMRKSTTAVSAVLMMHSGRHVTACAAVNSNYESALSGQYHMISTCAENWTLFLYQCWLWFAGFESLIYSIRIFCRWYIVVLCICNIFKNAIVLMQYAMRQWCLVELFTMQINHILNPIILFPLHFGNFNPGMKITRVFMIKIVSLTDENFNQACLSQ